jgi:hypothetical protein
MIANTIPPDLENNKLFKRVQAKKDEGNQAWLKRVRQENKYGDAGGLLLIGGNSVVDFRLRVAQSYLRYDLTPSYWSQVGILSDKGVETFYSVPLQWRDDLSEMPHRNGIQLCNLSDYDSAEHFPNIAWIQFTDRPESVLKAAETLKLQRANVVDLVAMVVKWLGYVWGVSEYNNPLLSGVGMPSAVFAETVYGVCGIELTPGLESSASCPESIWQGAKFWHNYYEESSEISTSQAKSIVPQGCFALRQPAAAVYEKPFVPRAKSKETAKSKNKE